MAKMSSGYEIGACSCTQCGKCFNWADRENEPHDPKGEAGKKKPQLHLIPPVANVHMAAALADGANKYGPFNWRKPGTKLFRSTYIAAIKRHVDAILDGEDVAPDSGVSHLGHIMSNCAILLDAEKADTLHNDLTPYPNQQPTTTDATP